MQTRLFGISTLLLSFVLTGISRADIPRTIAFQGALTNSAHVPLPDGTYKASFRLFETATGGTAVWAETDKSVTVSGGNGSFSTSLGDVVPFGSLPFDRPYYLEIQVSGEANPMSPRLPLQSVPYALSSGAANLTLPFTGSTSTSGDALSVSNTGAGHAITATSAGSGIAGASVVANNGSAGGIGVLVGTAGTDGSLVIFQNGTGPIIKGFDAQGTNLAFEVRNDGTVAARAVTAGGVGSPVRGISTGANILHVSDGVYGESDVDGSGVHGVASANGGVGVFGEGGSNGVEGHSSNTAASGVYGQNDGGFGVAGRSNTGIGVFGDSTGHDGVQGATSDAFHSGVAGINRGTGNGVYGVSFGGGYAGFFDGKIRATVVDVVGGSDVAERFDVNEAAEPGTVVAIDPNHPGRLRVAAESYDSTVAGVVSGANKLGVGLVLPDATGAKNGLPVAMTGRVWAKCDATFGAIRPGDLLTTSETPGYAMRVTDHSRANGAILGKAMTALRSGRGLVLVLVSLQ